MDKVVRNSRVVVYNRKDSPLATSRTWEREVVATSAASLAAAAASATAGGTGGIESEGGEPLDCLRLCQVHGKQPLDLWRLRDALTTARLHGSEFY